MRNAMFIFTLMNPVSILVDHNRIVGDARVLSPTQRMACCGIEVELQIRQESIEKAFKRGVRKSEH